MVNWRVAINAGLRKTTGYQLNKAAPDGGSPTAHQRTLVDAARAMGYRVAPLGDDAFVASPRHPANRGIVVDPLDKNTWVAQRGGRRREAVQIGADSLRTHLVLDLPAARKNPWAVQRLVGAFVAHEQVSLVLRTLDIDVVLDVGANIGQFATQLRSHGYRGRIVSFEPIPQLAARLRERAKDDDDWMVFDCALGEEAGTAEINATPGTLSSLLEPSDFGRDWSASLGDAHTETITVSRLDSLWEQITEGITSPRVYMKMDTQGFDLQAFAGAGDRIADVLALQSEVACVPIYEGMARMPESLAIYEGAGFEIAGMYPVTFHRSTLRVIEFDMIMVRADAAPGPDSATEVEADAGRSRDGG
jgi:FkbM family methyltransferase